MIKKWKIPAAVIAALLGFGISVYDFDPDRGYPLVNQDTADTTWFADSLSMVAYVDSVKWAGIDTSHVYVCINHKGRIVDYIDPKDWVEDISHILRNVNPAFKYMAVPRNELVAVRASASDSTKRVDYSIMETSLGDTSFCENFHDGKSAIVLPKGIDYLSMVKDKKDVDNPIIVDRFAWSIGDSTIGSGASYATGAAWATDEAATMTGNASGIYISNVTETGSATLTIDLAGDTLVITSNVEHAGNPSSGWVVSIGHNSNGINIECEGAGTVIFRNINIKRTVAGVTGFQASLVVNSVTTGFNMDIYNCLFDGNNLAGIGLVPSDVDVNLNIWNCAIWDFNNFGIYVENIGTDKYENLTFHSNAVAVDNQNNAQAYNNCLFSANTANFSNNTNSISNNCGTDKANVGAATDNSEHVNLTVANEVYSVDDSKACFLKVKDGVCDSGGTSPGIAGNTTGIRGNIRAAISIGADEYADDNIVYRSIGVSSVANLATGGTITISNDTATFSAALPDSVGVGDMVIYSSDTTIAMIVRRNSNTEYIVKVPSGGVPPSASAESIWWIYRAYTNLANAEAGTENTGIPLKARDFDGWSGGKDVAAAEQVWNIACYAENAPDATTTIIDGWTTLSDYYLKVYTPYLSTGAGTNQRHLGVWDADKYNIELSSDANGVTVRDKHVRIEGLQLSSPSSGGATKVAIEFNDGSDSSRLAYCLVRNPSASNGTSNGVRMTTTNATRLQAYNNIVYDFEGGNAFDCTDGTTGSYPFLLYNNTMVNCDKGIVSTWHDALPINNIARACTDGYDPGGAGWHASSDYNSSSVSGDAPTQAPRDNTVSPWYSGGTATAAIFADSTNKDFHLIASTIFQDSATADPGSGLFGDDIDMETRPTNWSLGADEYIAAAYDTSYRDTTYSDTLCNQGCGDLQHTVHDTMQVDSVFGGDTTLNWFVAHRTWDDTVTDAAEYCISYDTTYRDTTYDSTCLGPDLQIFLTDTISIDSVCGTDTTALISARDSVVADTVLAAAQCAVLPDNKRKNRKMTWQGFSRRLRKFARGFR